MHSHPKDDVRALADGKQRNKAKGAHKAQKYCTEVQPLGCKLKATQEPTETCEVLTTPKN